MGAVISLSPASSLTSLAWPLCCSCHRLSSGPSLPSSLGLCPGDRVSSTWNLPAGAPNCWPPLLCPHRSPHSRPQRRALSHLPGTPWPRLGPEDPAALQLPEPSGIAGLSECLWNRRASGRVRSELQVNESYFKSAFNRLGCFSASRVRRSACRPAWGFMGPTAPTRGLNLHAFT